MEQRITEMNSNVREFIVEASNDQHVQMHALVHLRKRVMLMFCFMFVFVVVLWTRLSAAVSYVSPGR